MTIWTGLILRERSGGRAREREEMSIAVRRAVAGRGSASLGSDSPRARLAFLLSSEVSSARHAERLARDRGFSGRRFVRNTCFRSLSSPRNRLRKTGSQFSTLRPSMPRLSCPSLIVSRTRNWWPAFLLPSTWRSLMHPLYALPAWFLVGRGIDALLRRTRVTAGDGMTSILLALVPACLLWT